MKYIKIFLGLIKISCKALVSGKNINFSFPIRFSMNAILSRRRGGKIKFGKHVSVNSNAHLYVTENARLSVGSFTGIGDNDVIVAREKISIGDNVMIGPNVCIYDHDHCFKKPGIMRNMGYTTSPVIIEDNVWIAAGVIILKGVTIGTGSVIAAGTVVTKDIPSNTIVYNTKKMVIKEKLR